MTYAEAYGRGKRILAQAGVAEAELDARLLLEFVCKTGRNTLLAHGDRDVTAQEESAYERLISRREARIPLQQLTGEQSFMGLDFSVNGHVLIPRQDTEILAEEVLRSLHDGMRVLDMCTGSGCILISLLRYSNDCTGVGADCSAPALEVAEKNARRLLGAQGRQSWSFVCGDLFEAVEGTFDIIVSNPPYIPSGVIDSLMPEVRDHEPRQALDGAEDGLFFYRRITAECGGYLARGGMLFFEVGFDQAGEVRGLMKEAGFSEVKVVKDYAGLDRVVYGTRSFAGM